MKRIFYYIIICITIGTSCVSTTKREETSVQEFHNISYGKKKGNVYDLFLPKLRDDKDTLALILYIHGGSWLGGDKFEHHNDCRMLVNKGYVTATMNYSLLNEEGVSIFTMMDEIKSCIAHITQFSKEKGVIINQMAIAGTSAGGHLAMMYSYSQHHSLPIKFEAIKVGPSDFRILFPNDENSSDEDLQNFVFQCTGKRAKVKKISFNELDSIKLIASPINYINDSTALPAIWAYGEKDDLVNPGHYKALKTCYDKLDKPYDLIVFPNSNHFLWDDRDCTERYDSVLNEYCKIYFGY